MLSRRREAQNGSIKYFQLQWARTEAIFCDSKIVVPYRTKENAFAYNDSEWFCRSDCYVITAKSKSTDLFYILGLLNSKLNFVWLYNRGKRKGEILELFQVPLSEIPIIDLDEEKKSEIAELSKRITMIKKDDPSSDTGELEAQIDSILYTEYQLTAKEIEAVEASFK